MVSEGRGGGEWIKHVERVARENAALLGEGSRSELIVGEKGFKFIERGRWRLFGFGFGFGFGLVVPAFVAVEAGLETVIAFSARGESIAWFVEDGGHRMGANAARRGD